MTTYEVSPGGLTMNQVAARVQRGDEVIIAPEVYELAKGEGIVGGNVKLTTPGVRWYCPEGRAVFRGDWGPWLLSDKGGKAPTMPDGGRHVGGALRGAIINVTADDVALENIVVECVPATAVDVAGSRFTARNLVTYWTRQVGLNVRVGSNSTPRAEYARGLMVEDCRFLYASVGTLDPAWVAANRGAGYGGTPRPDPATGTLRVSNILSLPGAPVIIRRVVVGNSPGEGFDCGKGVIGSREQLALVEECIFYDCRHALFYINAGQFIEVRNCRAFVTENSHMWRMPPGDGGYCYAVRDERPDVYPVSHDILFEGNIAAGGDGLLVDRRGEAFQERIVVRGNTFVAGPKTAKPLLRLANGQGVLEGNVIHAPEGATAAVLTGAARWTARGNAWNRQPPATLANERDVVGALGLVAPGVTVRRNGPDWAESYAEYASRVTFTFREGNYRPRADSPLLRDSGYIGALGPDGPEPPVEPPPPPPPVEVDWAGLATLAAEAMAEAVTAHMAADRAARAAQTLENRIREYELAAGSGEE